MTGDEPFGGVLVRKALRALLISFLFTFSLGFYFTNRLMYMKKKDEQFIVQREKEAGRFTPNISNHFQSARLPLIPHSAIPLKLCSSSHTSPTAM